MRVSAVLSLFFLALSAPLVAQIAHEAPPSPETRARYTVTEDASSTIAAVALGEGRLLCVWVSPDATGRLLGANFGTAYDTWFGVKPVLEVDGSLDGVALLWHPQAEELWLFSVERPGRDAAHGIYLRRSTSGGARWSAPETLYEAVTPLALGNVAVDPKGAVAVGLVARATGGNQMLHVIHSADGGTWERTLSMGAAQGALSEPVLTADADGFSVYFTHSGSARRYVRIQGTGEGEWSRPERVNLPSAVGSTPARTAAMLVMEEEGVVAAVARDHVLEPDALRFAVSYDGGRSWPVRRHLASTPGAAAPLLVQEGAVKHVFFQDGDSLIHERVTLDWAREHTELNEHPPLANVVPPLEYHGHDSTLGEQVPLPIADEPVIEHVRVDAAEGDWPSGTAPPAEAPGVPLPASTRVVRQGDTEWVGTEDGLFAVANGEAERHPSYGADGPPSNVITGLAVDSRDTLWVATPAGLAARDAAGEWEIVRGREGLPWEALTALAVGPEDRLWIGSTRGVILHRPYAEGRQWYYRAGPRYLPNDEVRDVAVPDDGRGVLVRTGAGVSRINEAPVTMFDKAELLEARYNERKRRLGLASPAQYDDAYTMASWTHGPQPSDGLWTGYHVTAMSLAYSLTGETRYRESARESMEALYLLQNVTGVPGLVARTVVSVDEPAAADVLDQTNWHLTADGRYMWRDDVSSDQYDGHYMAFHAYFEHIAQFDPEERARLEQQVRQVTDYLLDNNYQIPDWTGERTMWGWFDPDGVNNDSWGYLESGLYSLMMLSFLKVTHYATDDELYLDHFRDLIENHGYLSNLLLQKKLWPDELNHSDDQLSAVAFYPILQLEHNPYIRNALHKSIRRHALIETRERNSFFALVYASIAPEDADVTGAVQTLREIPRDRRNWRQENSHRADIVLVPNPNRGGQRVMLEVLPYDEWWFQRWNMDPYVPDGGGNGSMDDSGEHYLLPYWLGRYHGVIAAP